ncbi:MAG: tRNA pseudouridine(55) synthase TruB [Gammaproteobacteria bacterium]
MHGLLLLDKPSGISSNAALQKVKRILALRKAGHTGSLDPLATGMLPICIGEATKFAQYLLDSDKYYQTTLHLGITTTTGDAEGEITSEQSYQLDKTKLTQVLPRFTGKIKQQPPMFSAIKQQGQPLYKLARQGIAVDRVVRVVTIHKLQLLAHTANTITLYVHCSKGTYIRSLAEDIGKALGCGAYVSALRRLQVYDFKAEQMIQLPTLQAQRLPLRQWVLPIDLALQHLPAVTISPQMHQLLRIGQAITLVAKRRYEQGLARLYNSAQQFLGIVEITPEGKLFSKRLIQQFPVSFD